MFFDMDLLCFKRQGKFAVIWLAATRGIKSLKNKEIQSVDVSNICDEILKFVVCNDPQLNKRLSLNLSAKLIHGVVLVHRQQVVNFQNNMFTFYFSIQKPLIPLECEDEGEIRRKKITRTKKRQELNDVCVSSQADQIKTLTNQLERRLEIANDNVIDPIYITLPDDPTRKSTEIPDLFGDEGQIDKQLALLTADNWMNIPDFPIPEAIVVPLLSEAHDSINIVPEMAPISEPINVQENIPSALETTPRKSKRPIGSPDVEQSPSKRKKQTDVPDDSSIAVHLEAARPLTPRVVPRAEPQDDEMPPPRRTTPIRRRLSRSQVPIDLYVETPSRLTSARLYRPVNDLDSILRSPQQEKVAAAVAASAQKNDPKELIALILAGVRYDEDDVVSVLRGTKDNISIESVRADLTTKNILGKTIESIPEQNLTGVPIQGVEAPLPQQEVDELPPMQITNLSDLPIPSPRLSKIPNENRVDEISDVQPARLYASTPKSKNSQFATAVTRQNTLLDLIRSLFLNNGNSPIQLEQLCRPLTRFNIATTFSDLLYFQSKQYITLESAPGTIELKNIYPGAKLN